MESTELATHHVVKSPMGTHLSYKYSWRVESESQRFRESADSEVLVGVVGLLESAPEGNSVETDESSFALDRC